MYKKDVKEILIGFFGSCLVLFLLAFGFAYLMVVNGMTFISEEDSTACLELLNEPL